MNLFCEPGSLDSRLATDLTSVTVLLMLSEGLMRLDGDHKPKYAIAQRATISDDGRVYTFFLRDALWSNGDQVQASDFANAWRSILEPNFPSPFAYKLFCIKNAEQVKTRKLSEDALGIRVIDEKTLEVTLEHPAPYFLELLAFPTFYPIHPLCLEEEASYTITNGPFNLTKWVHESGIRVEKNPLYWDRAAVSLAAIDMVMIADTMTEFLMYENGQLDIAGSPISSLPIEAIEELNEKKELIQMPMASIYYFKLNTQCFPLTNAKIRRALALAIDRQEIVDHIAPLNQKVALSYVPPLAKQKALCCNWFEDGAVKKAQALFNEGLKELGVSKNNLPPISFLFNTSRQHKRIAEAVAHRWETVFGITVSLDRVDWKVFLNRVSCKDFMVSRAGWVGDMTDPLAFLAPYKQRDDPSFGGNNNTNWEDAAFASFLNQANRELNTQKRSLFLQEAERVMMDAMPVIPLFFITAHYVHKPYVSGIYYSPLGIVDFKKSVIGT